MTFSLSVGYQARAGGHTIVMLEQLFFLTSDIFRVFVT